MDSEPLLQDAARRLSSLQLNDYREAQRVSMPPAELVAASRLLHAILAKPAERITHDQPSGDERKLLCGEVAMHWFRTSIAPLGARFGEHAQRCVAEFQQQLLAFDAFECSTERFETVERELCRVCLRSIDERIQRSLRSKESNSAGGMSDHCRALRVASALTRWVLAVTHRALLTRRQQQSELVRAALEGAIACMEAHFADVSSTHGAAAGL